MRLEANDGQTQVTSPVPKEKRIEVGQIFGGGQVRPKPVIETPEQTSEEISRQWFRENGNA